MQVTGNGFDSATFQIERNGTLLVNQIFNDLAAAQSYFSNNLLSLLVVAGFNELDLAFSETIRGGGRFSFDYAAIAPTPVPPTLLLFATGLGALGMLGWRRKKKGAPAARIK